MNSGTPRPGYFVADALHRLRHPFIPTVVAILVAFAGTTAIFATTGLAVASQQRTLERINSPQGRLIAVTDPQGSAGLSPESVEVVSNISGVEWAVGIGPATDVSNAAIPGSATVTARRIYGELPPAIETSHGNQLLPGQALAGPDLAKQLGFSQGVGAIESRTLSAVVVGNFSAGAPLTRLNGELLVGASTSDSNRLLTLWVSVSDVAHLQTVTRAVTSALVVESPGALRIDTSKDLALLSSDVAAELATSARLLVTALLLAVAILIGILQFGRVSGMAKDIGRSRALGASRSTIVLQILINAGACGIVGAGLGTLVGVILDFALTGQAPVAAFSLSVGILMVLAALAGSIAPAIRAARLDPVRILRVP